MINRVLNQYGVAAPPSIMPVAHPEDSQPNERIHGRNRNLPPRVANTARPPRFDRILSNSGQPFFQHAIRGSGSWRGQRGGPRFSSGRQEMQSRPTYNPREDHRTPYPGSSSRSRTYVESRIHNVSREPLANLESHSRAETSDSLGAQQIHLRTEYRSPSPKLPPEPLRRRTPQNVTPIHSERPKPSSSRPPLPGRKRIVEEPAPGAPPPAQKLKVMEAAPLATHSVVMDESSSSHKPIPTSHRNLLNVQGPSSPHLPIISSPKKLLPVVTIKDEPSSPEPTVPSRKLVTEACKFWPIPDNCKKSAPNYSENRLEFAKEQSMELSKLGLRRTKVFFREDGLVIEWKSEIPVWNDTLLPELSRSTTPLKTSTDSIRLRGSQPLSPKRKRDSPEVIDVDALPTPIITPKKSKISHSANSVVSQSSSTKDAEQSSSVTPSPRKARAKSAKHWALGLSKADIRNLGKCDQSAPTTQQLPPTPSSHSKPSNSAVMPSGGGVEPNTTLGSSVPSPTKRPALPTRIKYHRATRKDAASITTPMERKKGLSIPTYPEQSFEDNWSLLSNDGNHELSQTKSRERARDNIATKYENPKKYILDGPSVGEVVAFLPDRMPPENHVPWCDAVADIASIPVLEQNGTEDNQGERQAWLDSTEHEIQDQTSTEGIIHGDSPEYEMAEEFIRRFILHFDSDRMELQMAYSKDALFSYRVHRTREAMTSEDNTLGLSGKDSTKSNSIAHSIDQGRNKILQRLSSFENYYFSPRGVPSKAVHYDLAALPRKVVSSHEDPTAADEEDVGVILATLHSEFVKTCPEDENLDHTWTLDQSFVLRRRIEQDDDVNGDNSDLSLRLLAKDSWPLVAISHQMTLREEPLLPADEFDEFLACT